MKQTLVRLTSDYGMVFVLLALCGFFSVVTNADQSPSGEIAANQVAALIHSQFPNQSNVMIAVRDLPEDRVFLQSLRQNLDSKDSKIVATALGEPSHARNALLKLLQQRIKLDAIACTRATADWLVFSDLKTDFPALGEPRIVKPQTYRWPNFLKSENLLNIANQIAVIAIVAIGMTMVIITGGIDLSVGSLLALSAVLSAKMIRDWGGGVEASVSSMVICCLFAIFVCGTIGSFSGAMITQFAIPPFIVTLAMMLVCSGMAFLISGGQSIYEIPDSFVWLGRGSDFLHLPNAVVLMLVLYGVAYVLMSRMRLGRYLFAVGGNREASRLSGVPVKRVLLFAYVASAVLAGLGGIIMASQLKSGSPTYGGMYELYVIAAVVVGGTSLSGGEGKMLGTLIGAFTIAVIQNGMNLTNIESYTQKVVLGLVILGAVLVDKLRHQ